MKRLALLLALSIAALLCAPSARAQDRKAEAVARDALQGAQADYATGAYEKGITRLRRATRACGKCSSATRALLLRDTGAIEFHSGDEDGGAEAFGEALKIEPNAELSQRYDTPEVRAAWNAAKDEMQVAKAGQPTGDFVHTPAIEQAIRTPLPVYAEVDAQLSRVTVRYKGASMKDYGRFDLSRVGKGWGGMIPCGDVTRGVMRYYLVGVDSSGTPAATSGDPRRPFFVRVRPSIASTPPSLPGQPPPKQCTGSEAPPPPPPPPPAAVTEPGKEREKEIEPEPTTPGKKREFARLWIGVGGALDLGIVPSGNNVCKLTADGQPQNSSGYFCTDPNGGTDFPANKKQNDALIPGKSGSPGGGIGAGDARVLISIDYAVSSSFLVGGRIGYVANGYPGSAASAAGKAFGPSLHFEARATYLFGQDPLARVGFAPIVMGAAGIAEFDIGTVTQTSQTGIAGQSPTVAWHTGGPFFIAGGGGVRYAFSPSIGFWSIGKLQAAIGGAGLLVNVSPEIALQYGF